ncbi:MAG: Ig-like domain repeat protein [Acidobacteria bacterium]|nr:Ig-like domain repeat protein [Acidobacteriota bacterium]
MPIFRFTMTMLVLLTAVRVGGGQVVSAPVLEPPPSAPVVGGQSVAQVPSTVSLQITTPLTVFYGEAVDGLAQVTANDGSAVTGTVTFYDGPTSFCTLTLADGASCPPSVATGFGAGTHVFTAAYSGDATHAPATSNAVTVVVKQDATATTMASSVNPIAAGGNVLYTAQVQGEHGPVAGKVGFFDGAVSMGSVAVDGSGRAALPVLMVAPGTHAITAVYAGDANSVSSTSAELDEDVTAALSASMTMLNASTDPVAANESITFTAHVTGGTNAPTGMVAFVEGGTVLGSSMLNASGVAAWSTSSLSVGGHSIVARYAGDASTAPSVSGVLAMTVTAVAQPSDGFTLSESVVTVTAGGTAVVPVKVAAGSIFAKAMSVSCSGLPDEASCLLTAGALKIRTVAPRDCATPAPYGAAGVPLIGPILAGLFAFLVPQRRRALQSLLIALCAVLAMGAMTGCGTGNCTDLGSRPGTYTVTVTGSAGGFSVSQKVTLVVKP